MAQTLKSTVERYKALERSETEPTVPTLKVPLPPEYKQELEREASRYHHAEPSEEEESENEGEDSATRVVAALIKLSWGAPPALLPQPPRI